MLEVLENATDSRNMKSKIFITDKQQSKQHPEFRYQSILPGHPSALLTATPTP